MQIGIEAVHPDRVVEALREDGFAFIPGILSENDIARVRERLHYIASHPDFYRKQGVYFRDETVIRGRQVEHPLERFSQLSHVLWRDKTCWDHLLASPKMLALAKSVLGPDFYVNHAGCFLKPAHVGSRVPWHQDSVTWGVPLDAWTADASPGIFDFWIALDQATLENGCLQLLPGSHQKGLLPHSDRGGLLREADPTSFGFDVSAALAIEAQPGDLVVYHQDMFHCSDANETDKPRLAGAGTFVAKSDLPLMRKLFPRHLALESAPVCRRGHKVELKNSLPEFAAEKE